MQTTRSFAALTRCSKRISSASSHTARLVSSSCRAPPSPRSNDQNQDDPIPTKPTWSVHALLASYPRPRISHEELTKLHTLSALVPPVEGSEEAERMRGELEELVRLVEAVRLVDTSMVDELGGGEAAQEGEGEGEGEEGEEEGDGEGEEGEEEGDGGVRRSGIPDRRIWEEGRGMSLSSNTREVEFEDGEIESGKELLKHAKVTKDGFYVVEVDRRKK